MSDHNAPVQTHAAPVESEQESSGGLSLAPPAFSLAASSLSAPSSKQQQGDVVQRFPTPTDGPNVLPADTQRYQLLQTYVQALPARLRSLQQHPRNPVFQSPNFESTIQVVERLSAQLQSQSLRVRFVQSFPNPEMLARYIVSTNTIELMEFSSGGALPRIVANLVHEYTHREQDAAIEQALLSGGAPIYETEADDHAREMGGRQNEAYLATGQIALGEARRGANRTAIRESASTVQTFEAMLHPTSQNSVARDSLNNSMRMTYLQQYSHGTPNARFRMDLTADRHLILHGHRDATIDLGEIPATEFQSTFLRMRNIMMGMVIQRGNLNTLFIHPTQGHVFHVALFTVFHDGRNICEFEMDPPPGLTAQQPQNNSGTNTQQPQNNSGTNTQQPQNNSGTNTQQPQNNSGTNTQQPQNNSGTNTQQPQNNTPAQRQVPVPLHGRIQNSEPNVLEIQRNLYQQLCAYVVALVPEVQRILAQPPAGFENLAHNPNAQQVAAQLQRLASALQAESVMIRFDPNRNRSMTNAAYQYGGNVIVIGDFTAESLPIRIASLLHEFVHHERDSAMEQQLSSATRPQLLTGQDDAQSEYEGNRTSAYMTRIMQALGRIPSTDEGRMVTGNDGLLFDDYETVRTGNRHQRRNSEERLRMNQGLAYGSQFTANHNTALIRADLTAENHVVLYMDGSTRDLGQLPDTMTNASDIRDQIRSWVNALSDRESLFHRSGRHAQPYQRISIVLFDQGRRVAEAGIPRTPAP